VGKRVSEEDLSEHKKDSLFIYWTVLSSMYPSGSDLL
jgi:hypothetical protein